MCNICLQDTCTGFLLGGVGELNKKREPNFLVVNKGKSTKPVPVLISLIINPQLISP